jgi:long-chain acyl-CoA synthetase
MQQRWEYNKPDNLVDLCEEGVRRFANNRLFGVKTADGKSLNWSTYSEIGKRVDNLRAGLALLGVEKGDSVGIISNNCPEWAIAAFASYGRGAIYVPMYEAELIKICKYIIRDSGVKVLFVSKKSIYEKVKDFPAEITSLEKIILIEGDGPGTMKALEAEGEKKPVPSIKPDPYDVATIIYTSGTTGDPKGVLLSHGNYTHMARCGCLKFPELDETSVSISILPWAHVFGQCAELYGWFRFGGSIGFMEKTETLLNDIALIRPKYIIAVPRIFNKIYMALFSKIKEEGGMAEKLFMMGVNAAKERRELMAEGRRSLLNEIKFRFADKVVFKKIRERFGGRLEGALTASATMNVEVAQFFFDIGIPVFDCYGLTETSPGVTMNCFRSYRLGSVGQLLDRITVKIDKSVVEPGATDGEIIVYGPSVMLGYHKKPEETRAVMTEDGGFRTGDRGKFDEDGFLYITGRIKEQFKLENGKYVFPASLEEDIKLNPVALNAMIFGEGKPYNICLVYPDYKLLKKYAESKGLPTGIDEMAASAEIIKYVEDEIAKSLKGRYGGYEIPKKVILMKEDFTVENGMMTHTMKLKRKIITEKFKEDISRQY